MSMLPQWDELAPIALRAAVLIATAFVAANSNRGELADLELKAEEAAATTQEVRAVNEARLADEYETIHELIRYHAVADAECDGALEVYERHFGDPHEWSHVLAACHSETPNHEHVDPPAEDPEQPHPPAEDPGGP